MSNHKTEAEYLAERGSRVPEDGSYFFKNDTETLLAAQVHATLALTEQQRIANLIAFYALADQQTARGIVPSNTTLQRLDTISNQVIEGLNL